MNRFFPVLLAGVVLWGACAPVEEGDAPPRESRVPSAARAPASLPAPADRSRTARGVVRSVTPSRSHLVVAHERIPGFMDAMTMPFRVADPSVVEGLAPGDSITFVFATGRDGVTIESVDPGPVD